MVQDILPAILPSVVADLRDWTVALRLNAARCLQSIFVLAGAAPSAHLPHLLSPLCSAAGDEEEQVAHYVVQAAQVSDSDYRPPGLVFSCGLSKDADLLKRAFAFHFGDACQC